MVKKHKLYSQHDIYPYVREGVEAFLKSFQRNLPEFVIDEISWEISEKAVNTIGEREIKWESR